jgi:hypothetical protein
VIPNRQVLLEKIECTDAGGVCSSSLPVSSTTWLAMSLTLLVCIEVASGSGMLSIACLSMDGSELPGGSEIFSLGGMAMRSIASTLKIAEYQQVNLYDL